MKCTIWLSVFFICNLIVSMTFNDKIKLTDLSTLISVLQNTSAMVFAISGIWIAYLYPKAVAGLVSHQIDKSLEEKSNEEIGRIKLIVGIIILSGLVMACLIITSLISPLIVSTEFYSNYTSFFSCLGLLILIILTEIQLFCLYGVIASCVSFIVVLQNQRTSNELKKRFGISQRPTSKSDQS